MMQKSLFLIGALFFNGLVNAQTLTIEITDVRNSNGHLLLGIYTNDKDYQDRIAIQKKTVLKTNLIDGKVTTTIEGLKPGIYGVALMDDENWDRKMEFKFLFPKEGFAFSNYYLESYRKPHFKDFKFELGKEGKKVTMRCKYLYKEE